MAEQGEVSFGTAGDATLVIRLAGAWHLRGGRPPVVDVQRQIETSKARRVSFDTTGLRSWDTAILTFLDRVTELCKESGISADREGLPSGIQRLLALAEAVPEKADARTEHRPQSWLERVGTATIGAGDSFTEVLAFLGEVTSAFFRLLRGRARYRYSDLFLVIQQVGAGALPIVTLISFLVGLILAFVGAVQLQQFGAAIYVADLVGIGMVREMGAMMAGIVMAGRTGAAFAAELGSMKVNQEIDALTTMGISPLEFLVLPRVIALCLMMPLLCLYADVVGILGGAAVGIGMLRLAPVLYFQETFNAVSLTDLFGGVFKATVYGMLIALSGCLRGMQSGRSSAAVGEVTTSAVVTSIVLIVSACGIFAVVFYLLGI